MTYENVTGILKSRGRGSITANRKKFGAVERESMQPVFVEYCDRLQTNMNRVRFFRLFGELPDLSAVGSEHGNPQVVRPDAEGPVVGKGGH